MPLNRRVYILDQRKLSPETIAVTFAKTSRSPHNFDEIANELSDEKSADFNEKWVVGYGHSSVAEHAVLHIALENISRLAVECVESNRLASYTEKSSRYQIWDREHFYIPQELDNHPLRQEYVSLNQRLFDHYQKAFEKTNQFLSQNLIPNQDESEKAFNQRLRTVCADACRFYLPASALANVGMTVNARALEHAITKLLSSPLSENRVIGLEVKAAAQEIVPTLVKYANENAYLINATNMPCPKNTGGEINHSDWMTCVSCDEDGETKVLAAILYRMSNLPFETCLDIIKKDANLRSNLLDILFNNLTDHDIPLRELEYCQASFDITLDQGAYFELKRHRMMSQTVQKLSCKLGYATPALFEKAGISDMFHTDMADVISLYNQLALENSHIAAYMVPNAFNRRVLISANLRSLFHFIKLRSAPNAHFSIRRVALRMSELLKTSYPGFGDFFLCHTGETWQGITEEFFSDVNHP